MNRIIVSRFSAYIIISIIFPLIQSTCFAQIIQPGLRYISWYPLQDDLNPAAAGADVFWYGGGVVRREPESIIELYAAPAPPGSRKCSKTYAYLITCVVVDFYFDYQGIQRRSESSWSIWRNYCINGSHLMFIDSSNGGYGDGCYLPPLPVTVPVYPATNPPTTKTITPSLMRAEKNTGKPCICVGNPINPGFGTKFQSEEDYRGAELVFERFFNSGVSGFASQTLGMQWRHSFNKSIFYGGLSAPNGMVNAIRPDGKSFSFLLKNGLWMSDTDINDRLQSILAPDGSIIGWKYFYESNKIDIFNQSGMLLSTGFINGYTQNLVYSDATTSAAIAPKQNLLIKVTDPFGRMLHFTYDAQSRITTMTVPDGGIYRYEYDLKNNLISVTAPDASVRRYLYEDLHVKNYLTGIIDENGNRFATWAYDGQGKAILSEHAGGVERVTLAYGEGSTAVTDARNVVHRYDVQVVNGVVKTTSLTEPNGSSSITYDVNGNISSRTDFRGGVTRITYDLARNLESSRTEGFGTPQARQFATAWHPTYRLPLTLAEPGKLTVLTYDANGNMLTKTETATTDATGSAGLSAVKTGASRKWSWTYNTAGQVLTATGPRTDVASTTTYGYDNQGNLLTLTNAVGQVTTLSNYDANGRAGRIVDANGLTTDLTYNPRGKLTRINSGGEQTSYDYDGVGQIVKVTMPDASSVRYSYDAAHRLLAVADSVGNTISYTLDKLGNRVGETATDPAGVLARSTARVYDALNRLQQVTGGVQ